MNTRKLLLGTTLALALGAFSFLGVSAQNTASAAAVAGCANTICGGVTYCTYSEGYSCSMTANSCTNTFCGGGGGGAPGPLHPVAN